MKSIDRRVITAIASIVNIVTTLDAAYQPFPGHRRTRRAAGGKISSCSL
jgi:hypothetical protein